MIVRPLAIFVALVFSAPSLAEENPLQSELDDIERQLVEVEALTSRYDGGLILGLIEARREALLLARTVVQNRINAEAGGATIEVVVSAIQTDERRAEQLLGEMAAAQERISQAESEAASSGGLVQALALSRLETERLTLAQLQMGYLQARYGIAFPIAQMPSEQVETSVIADEGAVEASGAEGQSVVWADPGFPNTDYTLQPFEQAHRDGHQISGWWTIEAERAAIDDSPQIAYSTCI